jgi:hypothetical protein
MELLGINIPLLKARDLTRPYAYIGPDETVFAWHNVMVATRILFYVPGFMPSIGVPIAHRSEAMSVAPLTPSNKRVFP